MRNAELEHYKKRVSADIQISQEISGYVEYVIAYVTRNGGNADDLLATSNGYIGKINKMVSQMNEKAMR